MKAKADSETELKTGPRKERQVLGKWEPVAGRCGPGDVGGVSETLGGCSVPGNLVQEC